MTCTHCTTAETVWHHGGTTPGCRGCQVRYLTRLPKARRDELYALEAEVNGAAAGILLRAGVKREYARLQELKGRAA